MAGPYTEEDVSPLKSSKVRRKSNAPKGKGKINRREKRNKEERRLSWKKGKPAVCSTVAHDGGRKKKVCQRKVSKKEEAFLYDKENCFVHSWADFRLLPAGRNGREKGEKKRKRKNSAKKGGYAEGE